MPTDQNFDYADRDGLIQQVVDLNAEIDSLNAEIGRLQDRCLEFVSAEEAAKWIWSQSDDFIVLMGRMECGKMHYAFDYLWNPGSARHQGNLREFDCFAKLPARLPESLPEVEDE